MAGYSLQSYLMGTQPCKFFALSHFSYGKATHGVYRNQDISIDCSHCDVFGNISLSGGGKIPDDPFPGGQIPAPADVLQMHPDFNFSGLWVGATFDELSAHFDFAISLNASNQTNQFTVALPSKTFSKSVCARLLPWSFCFAYLTDR